MRINDNFGNRKLFKTGISDLEVLSNRVKFKHCPLIFAPGSARIPARPLILALAANIPV